MAMAATTASPTSSQSASATPTGTAAAIPVSAANAGGPLLDGFVSYSIEFAFFPDDAGGCRNVLRLFNLIDFGR